MVDSKKIESGKAPERGARGPEATPGKSPLAGTQPRATRSAASQFEAVRPGMERALGHDFSDVSVRESSEALGLGARAFARGNEMVFAPGQADASTHEGRSLFGHELVHVVQQRQGLVSGPQGKGGVVSNPGLEKQADDLGERAARGERVHVGSGTASASGLLVQRKPEGDEEPSEPTASEVAAAEAEAADAAQLALLKADAKFIAALLSKLELDEELKVHSSATALLLSKFENWKKLNMLREFVAEVRGQKVGGLLSTLLGTDNAWKYLIAVLPAPQRNKLYAVLADGNINARNAGRFTEDIIEFWDVQMGQDKSTVVRAYRQMAKAGDNVGGVGQKAASGSVIVLKLVEYKKLDDQYGMKGTLLSKFLHKIDINIEVDAFLGTSWITQQTRLIDELKRQLPGSLRTTYMEILAASNLELGKGAAPDLMSVESSVLETVAETINSVGDLIGYIAEVSHELAEEAIEILARSAFKLSIVGDFIVGYWEAHKKLVGIALSCLNPKNILAVIKRIDPRRLGEFYGALVTLSASALFLPQLFAAYWLLPKDTRVVVFSAIGRAAFEPIIREAKAFIVPVLQDLIDSKIPVGTGFYFERGFSAGARIAQAGGESKFSIIRTSKDTFEYNERYALRGGVGVGAGVGKTEGKKEGAGKDKGQVFWGHELSANASAMAHLITQNKYSFPIMNDDAFVGFLAAFIDIEAAVSIGAYVFEELEKIDPMPYLKKSKIEHKIEGSGAATASTGLKQGKKGDTSGDGTHNWEDGQKPEEMGSSKWEMFGAKAGATVARLVEVGASLELEEKNGLHVLSLEVGCKSARSLSVNVPGLGLLSKAVPLNADAGTAVKLSTKIKGLAAREPSMVGGWTLSLVGTTGELDTYDGSGSETEVELATDKSFESIEDFIGALGNASFKRRVGLASGVGSKMLGAIDNQKNLTSQLKKKYDYAGIKVNGSVDLEFELAAKDTQTVARTILALLREAAATDDLLGKVKDAVMTFLTKGTLPKKLTDALAPIGAILKKSVSKASYHLEIGGAVAFGEEMFGEKDAKTGAKKGGVGVHGQLGAGAIFHADFENPLATVSADDVLDIITGAAEGLAKLETVIDLS